METNVNYTVVGAFVILLIMITIFGIIWLSGGLSTEEYCVFKVYMKEPVSGLSLDAPVEYNGVNVGNVSSISLNKKNPQLVELLLNIKSDTPITVGTTAKLGVKFLSGIAFILLEDRGTNMTPLVAVKGERYPVINTVPSFLLRVDTAITEMSKSFQDLSKSVHSLLDQENLNSIKSSLKSLSEVMNTLSRDKSNLHGIIENTSSATHMLKVQTLPDANVMMNNINNLSRSLNEVADDVKQNPSILIRGKSPAPLGPGEQ